METMLSPSQFFGLSRQEQAKQWQQLQHQLAELSNHWAQQRAENDRLRARLAEIEPFWQLHAARREGRRLTRQIRREVTDPAQRARALIAARDEGLLVSKPNWEELSGLMAATSPPVPEPDQPTSAGPNPAQSPAPKPKLAMSTGRRVRRAQPPTDPMANLPPIEAMASMSVEEVADSLVEAYAVGKGQSHQGPSHKGPSHKSQSNKGPSHQGLTDTTRAALRDTLLRSGIAHRMVEELARGGNRQGEGEGNRQREGQKDGGSPVRPTTTVPVGVPYPEISRQQRREQERTARRLAEKAARKGG